jgi:hypothetical protein
MTKQYQEAHLMQKNTQQTRKKGFSGKNGIYVTITAIMLLATILVAIFGFTAPAQVIKTKQLASYNLNGTFTQQASGYLNTSGQQNTNTDLIYFTQIINNATGSYTYHFLSDETVSNVQTQLEISLYLTQPSLWSKELVLVPSQAMNGNKVTFPLDIKGLLDQASAISVGLGLSKDVNPTVFLTATVHTEATVGTAVIQDDFIQTCQFTLTTTIIKWSQPLDLAIKGYQSGEAYEQDGDFGYSFTLSSNPLTNAATLDSPGLVVRPVRNLPVSNSYSSDQITNLDVNFAYDLATEDAISGINHQVDASAVLSNPDGKQIVFPLITGQQFSGGLNVKLPIDVTLLYDVINKMENTTDNNFSATYNLAVLVNVHTTATTPGAVDEKISAALPVTITASGLSIGDATGNTKTGTISSTTMEPNSGRSTLLMVALSLLALTVVMALWTGYRIWESRHGFSLIGEAWETTQETAAKHKDIFVNVAELPPPGENEKTIQIDSLAELVKLADALLKPVLHLKHDQTHVYCVIDGAVRYIYAIIEPLPKGK